MTRLRAPIFSFVGGAALVSVAAVVLAGCNLGAESNAAVDAVATPKVTESEAPNAVTSDDLGGSATQADGGESAAVPQADVVVLVHEPGMLSLRPEGMITLVDEEGNRVSSDVRITWWGQFGNLLGKDVGVASFAISHPSEERLYLATFGPGDRLEVLEDSGFVLPPVNRQLGSDEVLTRQSEPERFVVVDFSVGLSVQAMNRAQAQEFVRSETGQI